jgi:hypothetical protein
VWSSLSQGSQRPENAGAPEDARVAGRRLWGTCKKIAYKTETSARFDWLRGQPVGHNGADLVPDKERYVSALLVVLLLIVILAVLGFAVLKVLLWIAAIMLVLWLVGFFVRGVEGARWYRW